eukprot:g13083.t1
MKRIFQQRTIFRSSSLLKCAAPTTIAPNLVLLRKFPGAYDKEGHKIPLQASRHPKLKDATPSDTQKGTELIKDVYGVGEEDNYTSLHSGTHEFFADELKMFGGMDRAPNALSYFLASFVASEIETAHFVARKCMNPPMDLGKVYVHVRGHIDRRGFTGDKGVSATWSKIEIEVGVVTQDSASRVPELAAKVAAQCPIHVMIKKSGIPLVYDFKRVEQKNDRSGARENAGSAYATALALRRI